MTALGRRFLFIIRCGSGDDVRFSEALDMILTIAAFDQFVQMVFIDEGVRALIASEKAVDEQVAGKLEALDLYDVQAVGVGRESLVARGLSERDLRIAAAVVPEDALPGLISEHDRVFVI